MKNWAVVLLFLASFSLLNYTGKTENVCGDWVTYKEEKCITVITSAGTQFFEEAVKTCASHDGSKLISVASADEQAFLADFLFTKQHLVDSVWLGAKVSPQQGFHWEDGNRKTTFTNWAPGNPKNHSTESCVQIHAEEELRGKWSNEPCAKVNRVACEKGQTWSLQKMQEIIVKVIQNPVPLGFIYVQLPKEKDPADIWPGLTFTDISDQYDSTFFRVAGKKGAAAFGTVQEESSPYIDEIKYNDCRVAPHTYECTIPLTRSDKIPRSGGWTKNIVSVHGYIAMEPDRYNGYMQFHTAPSEVRPKNMAVKVWKRTG